MMENSPLTLLDVQSAAERIRPFVRRTPLLREATMDKALGCEVYVKPEMLQITGAFKLRGAMNKVLSLSPAERNKGIVTSSSGNHGQACAYIGQLLGIHATVIVPEDTPHIKVDNARRMGAEVILWDRAYAKRWEKVRQEVEEHGYNIVHAYEDFTVMAGQGTIGLEIFDDLPEIDTVLVPIGGGGLISGVSTALKALKPSIRIVGVQAAASDAYVASRKAGKPVEVACLPTIADGLSCRYPGTNPYPIVEKNVDEMVSVSEEDIMKAVCTVAREAKLIAEPSSCVGVAALQSGKLSVEPKEKVCCILTSGNWDIDLLGKLYNGEMVQGVE